MPTASTRSDGAPQAATIPMSVRIATVVMGVIAALLLLNAGLTWYGKARLAAAIVASRTDISRTSAERLVLLWMLPYLGLGLILALAAWFLPRGRAWARMIGLAASTVLALLTVFSALSTAASAASLLLLVLSLAALTCLMARATTAWVAGLRSGR